MPISITVPCLRCGAAMSSQMTACPACLWNWSTIVTPTGQWGLEKYAKHTELLNSGMLSFGNNKDGINASFDHNGTGSLGDVVRYAVFMGHRFVIPGKGGRPDASGIVSYLPDIIGTGISHFQTNQTPCSGLCILTPASPDYGHSFPALDQYVAKIDPKTQFTCVVCQKPSPFGHGICPSCYSDKGSDWRSLL